ncbi:MAG: hypothetical protein V1755_06625 [Chloroflexota bacterium]
MPFSHDEIRRFIKALRCIDEHGDPEQLKLALQEAASKLPAAEPFDNAPIGSRIAAVELARRVAKLLGIEMVRALEIVTQEYGVCRRRARYEAVIEYGRLVYQEAKKKGKP